ncbi:hypothetical protein [Pararhizobium sp. A13]|uniref:hypothetical protein n=1 Tax=Pararhizobium sp. A13 TaxID=3133975 RepID=UPI003244F063
MSGERNFQPADKRAVENVAAPARPGGEIIFPETSQTGTADSQIVLVQQMVPEQARFRDVSSAHFLRKTMVIS